MSEWIEVGAVADFQEPVQVVDYDEGEIAVFRLPDGFYAIENECSHAVAALAEGEIIDDCKIKCPRHGALFDIRSGKNLALPAVVPVKSFPVKVDDGVIYVEVDDF